jgi:hypothetical protein
VVEPASAQSWRDIILYGANTATYKFALGRSLLEVAADGEDFVALERLAVPFSRFMVEHVREVPRQSRAPSNSYAAICAHFLEGTVSEDELHSATLVFGFRYVLDAFPRVSNQHAPPVRFYLEEGEGRRRGLRLTDALLEVATSPIAMELDSEAETRWQLVERTWEARFGAGDQLRVAYEPPSESLVPLLLGKRRRFRFGVRPALNGYQRGHCF